MDKTFLCAMAVYDEETQRRIEEMRARLVQAGFVGRQTKNLPHHITLGIFQPSEQEEALAGLEEALGQTRAFPLTFNHVGVFGGGQVLFLAPDVNRELLALKEHFGASRNWTAHTTLLIDGPERVCAALPLALQGFEAFEGRVNGVQLYQFCPRALLREGPLPSQ